jgi:UDP-glucose 4-epimerase
VTQRAWITGARGFIGQALARHLANEGVVVAGLGHGHWPDSAADAGVVHWVNADIHAASLDLLLARAGAPDVIFHLAGGSAVGPSFANPLEDFERTVYTTARLLEWTRCHCPAAPLVAVSSAAVYGSGHEGPIPEAVPVTPYSPYGHHKAVMEALFRSYGASFGVRSASVRVFSAYGEGLRKQLLWDLCCRLAAGERQLVLDGTGGERRDWIHVGDVVRTLALTAATLPSAQCSVVNCGSGVSHTVAELAGMVATAWGESCTIGFSGRARPGDPQSLVADVSRMLTLGGDEPLPLDDGIAAYVGWFRASMSR